MHPAFSVIFFTVSSGAGFGLFALIYLADAFRIGGGLLPMQVIPYSFVALVLIIAGLISSTFHLGNPKNAWRAVMRFRTSWLSREGVLALAFFPVAMMYLVLTRIDPLEFQVLRLLAGGLATFLAWMTIFSTGMIYACLKTIRQWNTPLVPVNYLVLGHFAGAVILLLLVDQVQHVVMLAFGLLLAGAVLKAVYYYWIRTVPGASSIQTATGFTRAQVKLLDAGHTHGTFLTQEFGFQIARRHALLLKLFVFAGGFGLPALGLLGVFGGVNHVAGLVVVSAIMGLLVERWLFFAEARHVVNLFHGAQRC